MGEGGHSRLHCEGWSKFGCTETRRKEEKAIRAARVHAAAELYLTTKEDLYREALDIRRRLAETDPAAFEPDLADSCSILALLLLGGRKDREGARALFREALGVYERYPSLAEQAEQVRRFLRDDS